MEIQLMRAFFIDFGEAQNSAEKFVKLRDAV